jgi:hypothetical protein
MANIQHELYIMRGTITSKDQARIINSVIFQRTSIEVEELKMETFWLERIYSKHSVTDFLSKIGLEISQNFRAMRLNYGLQSALRYYGIDA